MGRRTRRRSRLGLLLVAGTLIIGATVGVDKVSDAFPSLLGGTTILGDGELRYMLATSASETLEDCPPTEVLRERRCGRLPVVLINAKKLTYISHNISQAWEDGKPGILTRGTNATLAQNRSEVCRPNFPKRRLDGSCDEYPFASTIEGGRGAREEEVPLSENICQGGTLSAAYRWQGINNGDQYAVVITNPDATAPQAYANASGNHGGVC